MGGVVEAVALSREGLEKWFPMVDFCGQRRTLWCVIVKGKCVKEQWRYEYWDNICHG
jgi:hypothetical protein